MFNEDETKVEEVTSDTPVTENSAADASEEAAEGNEAEEVKE